MNSSGESNLEQEIPANAVSIYGQNDALDDFPVLKAFQQYVDVEQDRARKRLVMISIFFGCLMFIVISVFVAMLMNISQRNQALNDRLIEFAMRERERPATVNPPVVVQQTPAQDNHAALMALTEKFQALQKQMEERAAHAETVAKEAVAKTQKPQQADDKSTAAATREIERLKALLAVEQEKNLAEREKRRQEELEEYRRKHYPDLYNQNKPRQEKVKKTVRLSKFRADEDNEEDPDVEIEKILNDSDAISYFDTEDDETDKPDAAVRSPVRESPQRTSPTMERHATETAPKESSIPVEDKGPSNRWSIPND